MVILCVVESYTNMPWPGWSLPVTTLITSWESTDPMTLEHGLNWRHHMRDKSSIICLNRDACPSATNPLCPLFYNTSLTLATLSLDPKNYPIMADSSILELYWCMLPLFLQVTFFSVFLKSLRKPSKLWLSVMVYSCILVSGSYSGCLLSDSLTVYW